MRHFTNSNNLISSQYKVVLDIHIDVSNGRSLQLNYIIALHMHIDSSMFIAKVSFFSRLRWGVAFHINNSLHYIAIFHKLKPRTLR